MNNKSRLNDIALLKTVMMAVIVLYHSMLFFGDTWFTAVEPVYEANYLYEIAKWMNTFHIQAFTMASGFLFYYLRARRAEVNHWAAIKKRAKRLLLPYLFTSILWVIPIVVYFFKYSAWEIFYKYGLMVSPSQLWYLVMLFGVFVFFEFFGKKLKMNAKYFVVVFIVTTVVGGILSKLNINVFQFAKIAQFVLYFYLGGYIYENRKKISGKQALAMTVGGGLLYGIVVCMSMFGPNWLGYVASAISPLVSVMEVGVIYYLCAWAVEKKKIKLNNKVYKLYEENSFGIYLFHQQIIYFTIIFLNGVVHPVIQVILSFTIASIISIAMTVVLRKFRVTRFMFGL